MAWSKKHVPKLVKKRCAFCAEYCALVSKSDMVPGGSVERSGERESMERLARARLAEKEESMSGMSEREINVCEEGAPNSIGEGKDCRERARYRREGQPTRRHRRDSNPRGQSPMDF